MSDNVVAGTGADGADLPPNDPVSRFMADLRQRQESVWAIVSHGAVTIDGQLWDYGYDGEFLKQAECCTVYLPRSIDALDVVAWVEQNWAEVQAALRASLQEVVSNCPLTIDWVLPVPAELATFVDRNTGRPMPRRYNSTAVQYTERDGIVWLTHPELRLYDALRETGWIFIPQPAFVIDNRAVNVPDFLVLWKGRAEMAVLVEIDSDMWHQPPSARKDERRSQWFQARNFEFMRFSAKECENPLQVIQRLKTFCIEKFGA